MKNDVTQSFTIMTPFGPMTITHVEASAITTDELSAIEFFWQASNGASGSFLSNIDGDDLDVITPDVTKNFAEIVMNRFDYDTGNLNPKADTVIHHNTRPTISKDTPVHPIEDGYLDEKDVCPECGEPLSNRGGLGDLKFFRCNICGQMLTLDDSQEYRLF